MSSSVSDVSLVGAGMAAELSEKQLAALEAVRAGRAFPQAAEDAGVNRSTIYRWLHQDPNFRAAFNVWQQEQSESARARLLKLSDKAVDVIDTALDCGKEQIAMQMLAKLGVMRQPARGATDPEVLRLQMELDRRRQQYEAAEALVRHLLAKMGLTPKEQTQYIRHRGLKECPGGDIIGPYNARAIGAATPADDEQPAGHPDGADERQ